MEQHHHGKIIFICIALVIIIVTIVGVAIITGRNKIAAVPQTQQQPILSLEDQRQALIKSTSATKSSSISDPEVQAIMLSLSAPTERRPAGDREALIRAMDNQ